MKPLTVKDFQVTLSQFSHQLTPTESNKLQLLILDSCSDSTIDQQLFKLLARFLTPEIYKELTKERNINKLCGYPLCGLSQARVNTNKLSSLLPNSYLYSYCGKRHYQCSEFYKAQLSDESLFIRKEVLVKPFGEMKYEKITLLEQVLEHDGNLSDVIRQIDGLNINKVEETEELSDLLKDIKIIEKEPKPPIMYEYLEDQSKAINGNKLGDQSSNNES